MGDKLGTHLAGHQHQRVQPYAVGFGPGAQQNAQGQAPRAVEQLVAAHARLYDSDEHRDRGGSDSGAQPGSNARATSSKRWANVVWGDCPGLPP